MYIAVYRHLWWYSSYYQKACKQAGVPLSGWDKGPLIRGDYEGKWYPWSSLRKSTRCINSRLDRIKEYCQFWCMQRNIKQKYFNSLCSVSEINLSNFWYFFFKGKDPQQRPVSLISGCSKGSSYSCAALKKLAALLWCQDIQQNAQKSGM